MALGWTKNGKKGSLVGWTMEGASCTQNESFHTFCREAGIVLWSSKTAIGRSAFSVDILQLLFCAFRKRICSLASLAHARIFVYTKLFQKLISIYIEVWITRHCLWLNAPLGPHDTHVKTYGQLNADILNEYSPNFSLTLRPLVMKFKLTLFRYPTSMASKPLLNSPFVLELGWIEPMTLLSGYGPVILKAKFPPFLFWQAVKGMSPTSRLFVIRIAAIRSLVLNLRYPWNSTFAKQHYSSTALKAFSGKKAHSKSSSNNL